MSQDEHLDINDIKINRLEAQEWRPGKRRASRIIRTSQVIRWGDGRFQEGQVQLITINERK